MNKRVFSLVCIVLYVLFAVLIQCSEQKDDRSKTSGLRSRVIRAIQKIKGSNKKNDIESQRETQLNNNNNNGYNDAHDKYPIHYRIKTGRRRLICCGMCSIDDE
ncbi:fam-c protein [Plasmodium vinckei lentum]|uniref:Fam-c protein n=1 Tax=Plasmodium vinckei lentum TaxID=138297 RepID=A0A6V7SFJ3_PLAVN|nr:fam-c protein [Plasmodium vinckei lentum]